MVKRALHALWFFLLRPARVAYYTYILLARI